MHEQRRQRRPFWYLRRRPATVATEVDEELRSHLEMRVAELRAGGLPVDEAQREALRRFGDLEYTRRYCRQQDGEKERIVQRGLMLEDLMQDFRISVRSLLRAPVMTLTIVATVGLGIGATTVIFSAVNAALLQPLPYADHDRLVRIYTDSPPNRFRFSVVDYLALQAQQTQFEQIAGYTDREVTFSDGTVAERVRGRDVSWTYFSLLGIKPSLGRDFIDADSRPGSPRSVILSHGFWQQRLGGRPDVVGKAIRIDGMDHAVAGVLSQTVGPLEQRQQVFLAAQWDTPSRKGPFFITVVARVGRGVDRSAAADELRAINRRIFPLWKASYQDDRATWSMIDLKTHVIGDVRTVAGVALAAVGVVWLIACANASNLLIARVTSRRRELSVRAALGASRARVMRHLFAESTVLATGAALVGIILAWVGVGLLQRFGASYFPRTQEITMDGPVLWWQAGLTAVSILLFGAVPAVHGSGGPLDESLRSAGRSSTGSPASRRLRRMLVGSQFAIATPLLVVAGLLLGSLKELERVDLGFDARNLVSGSIALPPAQYADPASLAVFWDELQRRLEALPGVAGVAFADGRPPNAAGDFNNFDLEEFPAQSGQSQPVTPWMSVTPDYFRLLGLTLLEGRLFDDRDGREEYLDVVVVDRAWARRFFPGRSAVGKRLKGGGCTQCPWTTVVGVVSEVKYAGLDRPDDGTVYAPMAGLSSSLPIAQEVSRFRFVILRTGSDPAGMQRAIRKVIHELDPALAFSNVATTAELVERSLQRPRSLSLLVGCFAFVALALSLIGIYGVMAHYVQQHAKDISIRLALGGSPRNVLGLVIGQGMKVVASGVAIGVLAALVATRLLSTLLFGVTATDAVTFLGASTFLVAIALIACLVPARRATGLEPAAVLREE